MSGENNFKDTVNSLFKGLDAFISPLALSLLFRTELPNW